MYFERDYFIHYYDSDLNLRASISALLRYFEDVAILHSEDVKRGLDYYHINHVGWVLYKWDIKIKRFPVFKEVINVRTKACYLKGFQAYRYFDILDNKGDQIVTANSMWLFVNSDSRRPAKIREDLFEGYSVDRSKMEMLLFGEIKDLEIFDAQKEFEVRYMDIDTNKHVNNIKYVEWAIEVVPQEITSDYTLSRLIVNYKKETSYGNQILSAVELHSKDGEVECIHQISSGDTLLCLLKTEWKK